MTVSRADTDRDLWNAWRAKPGDASLSPLLENLGGTVASAVRVYSTAPLPTQVLHLEGTRGALEAIKSYDPSRGVALATHVTNTVKHRLYRYVGTYQNVARIPLESIGKIGPYREAVAELSQKYGVEPTVDQIADHLGVPVTKVNQLRRLVRKDLTEGAGDLEETVIEHDADYEKAMLVYYGLTDQEKRVFDWSLGVHGAPHLGTGAMAKKLGVSDARVSILKKSVAEKIREHLGW